MAEFSAATLGFVITLMLHASVLLGTVWLLERSGALKHPGWAELAWRGALFGALLSAGVASVATMVRDTHARTAARAADVATVEATSDARGDESRLPLPLQKPPVGAAEAATAPVRSPVRAATQRELAPLPATATRVELPNDVVSLAAQTWLAVTLAALLLSLWRSAHLVGLLRRGWKAPRATAQQRALADAIAHQLQRTAPRLHLDPTLTSPVALPRNTILLPGWTTQLPEGESRALLAHELAHLARYDPFWRIAHHLALAPLCGHPLAWLALRRLDALAERQSDAAAARLLGDGRALAECLARCLQQRVFSPMVTPRFALAMAERPGAVVDRVQRLLEEDPMEYQPPSRRRAHVALVLGIVAALALPAFAVTAIGDALSSSSSIQIQSDGDGQDNLKARVRRPDYALDVTMEGQIKIAPDESDVLGMAADAEFEIEEVRDGVTRSIAYRRSGDGVSRDYRVEGKTHAFDTDARAWVARVLPEVYRSTGLHAGERAKRILARGGVDALFAEIALIESDYGRARYLGALYAEAKLDAAQQSRALQLTAAIDSDYELRQALTLALDSQQLSGPQQRQVLGLAKELESDYERAELLIHTADRFTLDDEATAHWSAALAGISSDYESRRVLEALLARGDNPPAAVRLAFEMAREIGSDYEKRQLLEAGVAHAKNDAGLRQEYLRVAADIGSDYERKEALLTLLRSGPVDAALALATLDAIAGIGSGYERKEALLALAKVMPADPNVIERYRATARDLGAYERGEAEQALDRLLVVK